MAANTAANFVTLIAQTANAAVQVDNRSTHCYFTNPYFDATTYNHRARTSRLSVHVNPDHLVDFKNHLITQLNNLDFVSSFKVENKVHGARTILDNAIIYYYPTDPRNGRANNTATLNNIIANVPPAWLAPGHAAMMDEVSPSVGYGEEDQGGRSFGELRTRAMADGIIGHMINQNWTRIRRESFIRAGRRGLRHAGLDSDSPHETH
jgi:hypothetical protein